MSSSRAVPFTLTCFAGLMTMTSAGMLVRATSRLQLLTAGLLLAASSIAVALLPRGRLLRWLRSPLFPPAFRTVGGSFCAAVALITSIAKRPAFLSFAQLNAAWLVLLGSLLLFTVLSDWCRWRSEGS